MHIEQYHHGKSLVLLPEEKEQERHTRMSTGCMVGCLGIILVFIGGGVYLLYYGLTEVGGIIGLMLGGIGLWAFLTTKDDDMILSLRVGKDSNALEIDVYDGKEVAQEAIPLSTISSLQIAYKKSDTSWFAKEEKDWCLRLTVQYDPAGEQKKAKREAVMWVKDVDLREESLDFSRRLAHVCKMAEGNITRNDPKFMTLDFFKTRPETAIDNPISLDDIEPVDDLVAVYAQDTTPKDERLDQIIGEPWDPKKHKMYGKVVEYTPREKLVMEYKKSPWVLIVMVIVFTVMTPLFAHTLNEALAIIGGCWGVILVIYLLRKVSGAYTPTRHSFSLNDKMLVKSKGLEEQEYPLDKVTKAVLCSYSYKPSKSRYYYCDLLFYGESGELLIAQTSTTDSDEKAYERGVAFAGALCNPLGIPLSAKEGTESESPQSKQHFLRKL